MDTSPKYPDDTLLIGGKPFLVSTNWNTVEKYNRLIFPLQLRAKASELGRHYAVVNRSDKKANHQYGQYALLRVGSGQLLSPSLDLVAARHAQEWVTAHFEANTGKVDRNESDLNSTKILITTVDNKGSSFAPAEYVVSMISPQGEIAYIDSGRSLRTFDSIDLADLLETEFQLDENITLLVIEDDSEAINFAHSVLHGQQLEIEKKLAIVKREAFDSAALNSDFLPTRVYRPSKIKIKKVGFFAAAGALLTAGWLGFSFLNQLDAEEYFTDSASWGDIQEAREYYKGVSATLDPNSSYWDDRTYRNDVLDAFLDSLSDNLYTPEEVTYIMRYINMTLPLYASEWELSSLEYAHNNFIATYKRLPKGKGVFFMLDEDIHQIDINDDGFHAEPLSLGDRADTRQYSIIPAINLQRQSEFSQMRHTLQQENAAAKKLSTVADTASKEASELARYQRQYENLGFFSKWFMLEGDSLFKEAKAVQEGPYNRALKDADAAKSAFMNTQTLNLENELIIGNKYDFVTMMQLDSFFAWTFPEPTKSFPDANLIEEKNKKDKKKKKKKKEVAVPVRYGPAIISYAVSISTQESQNEEGKANSYGISDMIRLGDMLNKPFVHVDYVNYDKINEQWEMKVHFFTKTQDYEEKVSQFTNKDV
ncbi:hypothetical protein [Alteromonas sp. 14N.309.X.WAT.G.H12]|uniref:hypothetical protein n=1 Tax=Alteromonas sp. 14N.309.X.WAT.G.H12 TaxID=3120824 RepID=UPI002FD695C6